MKVNSFLSLHEYHQESKSGVYSVVAPCSAPFRIVWRVRENCWIQPKQTIATCEKDGKKFRVVSGCYGILTHRKYESNSLVAAVEHSPENSEDKDVFNQEGSSETKFRFRR